MSKTVIVGAGIAGISAAYELIKAGKEVIIIEKENEIGGNARGFKHPDNVNIDPGVILLYDWYYAFFDMMRDIDNTFDKDFHSMKNEFTTKIGPFLLPISLLLKNYSSNSVKYYNNDFTEWDDTKIHLGILSKIIDNNLVGYCYDLSNNSYKEVIYPILFKSMNAKTIYYCINFVKLLSKVLNYISNSTILLNSTVVDFDNNIVKYIDNNGNITQITNVNNVILASPLNNIYSKLPWLTNVMNDYPNKYTKYYAVIVSFDKLPNKKNASRKHIYGNRDQDICVVSFSWMSCVSSGISKHVTFYVWNKTIPYKELTYNELINTVSDVIATNKTFNNSIVQSFDYIRQSDYAMPNIHPQIISSIKKNQGLIYNNMKFYCAGQYLGFAGLELSCYTGRLVAKKIIDDINGSNDSDAFLLKYEKIDQESIKNHNQTTDIGILVRLFIFLMIVIIMIAIIRKKTICKIKSYNDKQINQ
jgi:hypothetical protein